MSRPRIIHVIGSLELGGAERVLCALIERAQAQALDNRVITLLDRGPLCSALRDQGIAVETMDLRGSLPNPLVICQLARRIARYQPDLVVTWLYHSNLIGGLAARLAGSARVVWNIRHNTIGVLTQKRLTRWVAWCGARASRWLPTRTVYVGHQARHLHQQHGYAKCCSQVIPNGFDTLLFRPDAAARRAVRRELGLASDGPLVGVIGRFHPDKDHQNFLRAAALIGRDRPDAHFLLCGTDVSTSNPQLLEWLQAAQIARRCHLLGSRNDIPRLIAALDLLVSSSATEAMPNVVGEAMACGVPCVVTDVGDSALLVGPTGRVVPPHNAEALAGAALELLSLPETERRRLGERARDRIQREYSIDRMVSQHLQLWRQLAGQPLGVRTVTRKSPRQLAA